MFRSIDFYVCRTAPAQTPEPKPPQVAFIGGVADSNGYGWAIAKALAEAGATIAVGTWPPVLGIFKVGGWMDV